MRQDPSGWRVRWDEHSARQYKQSGLWADKTIADYSEELLRSSPNRVLVIDREREFTVCEIHTQAATLAHALIRRGYRRGDTISFQLPNWQEAVVINLAAVMAGFVIHPIAPMYRTLDVGFMLRDCRSKLIFVPGVFRNFNYLEMMKQVIPTLERPVEVIGVRAESNSVIDYESLISETGSGPPLGRTDPDAVKLIMYTSGTTGRPKAVLHSHNSLQTENLARKTHLALTASDLMFNPSPVTHVTGMLYSLSMPFTLGIPTVMLDVWEPRLALDMMRRRRVTGTVAATAFLQGLVAEAKMSGESLPDLRFFLCGGAQVPPGLIREAARTFVNCVPARIYGSTEVPCITAGVQCRDQLSFGADTDGEIWQAEARIDDPQTGEPMPDGSEGEIVARAPHMFLGYAREEDNVGAFDPDGFFRMGDLGRILDGKFVLVTGRKKDLIIRAGENISPKEIEDILFDHPAVQEISIVAMPDARTGEAACAFVILKNHQYIDLPEIKRYLVAAGVTMQKIPERVEVVADFPRTSAGKVHKHALRQLARELVAGGLEKQ